MAGIYIHIPFCKQACYYCDFHFSTNSSDQNKMTEAICRELELRGNYLGGEKIETIYFGGGTPSILTSSNLTRVMDCIHRCYATDEVAEITCEANPDDLTDERLNLLKQLGFNRLSIGIQTFNDEILKSLNRAHNSKLARSAYINAREVGFHNISVDLIYALPGQSEADWIKNINICIELQPEHISAYSLTIEEKTVFGKWVKSGKLISPSDATAAQHLEILMDVLPAAGYKHYEVSNFAKPGYYSRHNTSYWKQRKYLGVGPSAHSFDGVSRQYNVSNNHVYMKAISLGTIPAETEVLSKNDHINEYIMTSLRTEWGCDVKVLMNRFNYDLLSNSADYIANLVDQQMAFWQGDSFILSRKGILHADKIASDLFLT